MTRSASLTVAVAWMLAATSTEAFTATHPRQQPYRSTSSSLHMVLEKPAAKKIPKIEQLKIDSDHLLHPLVEVCG